MKNRLPLFFICFVLLYSSCSKNDDVNTSHTNANDLSVGTSANDFLSASKFRSVQFEIAYMPGYTPDAAAIGSLQGFLNLLINKPGGFQITQREIAASGKTTLTLSDIIAIEKNNRTVFNGSTSLGVFLLYADADYNQPNVLGIAYKNTSMVVFAKKVHENSGGVNQASLTKLEATTLEHESGHLLGLVDLGTNMLSQHNDVAHSNHCTNSSCLMYYATQVNMMGGILISGPVPSLDDNCRNDLRANGGK